MRGVEIGVAGRELLELQLPNSRATREGVLLAVKLGVAAGEEYQPRAARGEAVTLAVEDS
jgi:hypothetical protein